jgi:osmoprotectant transport system ATP-binding protein
VSVEYRDVAVTAPSGATILGPLRLTIGDGERVAYLGRSGAGKTTALKVINGLAVPASGTMLVDGIPLAEQDLVVLRRSIGYVMQHPALFPHRTVFDNIATVPRLLGWDETRTREAAETLLGQLGLPPERFASRYPRMLSGGEQQRVAIARAFAGDPKILFADEPTGNLDTATGAHIIDLLFALNARSGTTLVLVTHDAALAQRCGRQFVLKDGVLKDGVLDG